MVIDPSAVLAILQNEPERAAFNADQAQIARSAFRRFGKGRHPAGLNLGDCYSNALAQFCAAPLLFKGNDFGLTDVEAAIA
jgi:ribonuclease VapC